MVVPIVGASVGPSTVGSNDGSVVGALLLDEAGGLAGGTAVLLPAWGCAVG